MILLLIRLLGMQGCNIRGLRLHLSRTRTLLVIEVVTLSLVAVRPLAIFAICVLAGGALHHSCCRLVRTFANWCMLLLLIRLLCMQSCSILGLRLHLSCTRTLLVIKVVTLSLVAV